MGQTHAKISQEPLLKTKQELLDDALKAVQNPQIGQPACAEIEPIRFERIIPVKPKK